MVLLKWNPLRSSSLTMVLQTGCDLATLIASPKESLVFFFFGQILFLNILPFWDYSYLQFHPCRQLLLNGQRVTSTKSLIRNKSKSSKNYADEFPLQYESSCMTKEGQNSRPLKCSHQIWKICNIADFQGTKLMFRTTLRNPQLMFGTTSGLTANHQWLTE